MLVKASPGLKVPMAGKPHDYITEEVAIEVPDDAYYLRRLADGDLVLADTAQTTTPKKTTKGDK